MDIIDQSRQINQLCIVAKMYHELAEDLKSQLDVTILQLKIRDFADHCKDVSYLHKNIALIHAIAHLSSSAIRLYSIDEIRKSQSIRWSEYARIRQIKDKKLIKQEVGNQIDNLIHFLLRHMVAHSESEWKRFKKYKNAYEAMAELYFELDYCTIFSSYNDAIEAVNKELGGHNLRVIGSPLALTFSPLVNERGTIK
jgi:hypothetical protein